MNAPRRTRRSTRNPDAAGRLVGYVRVSTEEQARSGLSLDAQRADLSRHAAALGCELVEVFEDAGESGSLAPHDRPGLAAALDAVSTGRAGGLLVFNLSRLSRSVIDTLGLVERSEREGWRLASVREALDTRTPAGRMVITMLAALSQMEREQIAERTKWTAAKLASDRRARSRFLPFGYRLESGATATASALMITREERKKGKRPAFVTASPVAVKGDASQLVPNPDEQPVLARMLALRVEGLGAWRIAAELNKNGLGNGDGPTLNPRTGRPWNYGTIAAILRNHDRREAAAVA